MKEFKDSTGYRKRLCGPHGNMVVIVGSRDEIVLCDPRVKDQEWSFPLNHHRDRKHRNCDLKCWDGRDGPARGRCFRTCMRRAEERYPFEAGLVDQRPCFKCRLFYLLRRYMCG